VAEAFEVLRDPLAFRARLEQDPRPRERREPPSSDPDRSRSGAPRSDRRHVRCRADSRACAGL